MCGVPAPTVCLPPVCRPSQHNRCNTATQLNTTAHRRNTARRKDFAPRRIDHPLFENVSAADAAERLADAPDGEARGGYDCAMTLDYFIVIGR